MIFDLLTYIDVQRAMGYKILKIFGRNPFLNTIIQVEVRDGR